jgi:hypothetical protein
MFNVYSFFSRAGMVRSGGKSDFIASVVRDLTSSRIVSAEMRIHLIPRAIPTKKTAVPFISERWPYLADRHFYLPLPASSSATTTFHMAVSSTGTCEKVNYEIYESPFRVSPIKVSRFCGKLALLLASSLFDSKSSYVTIPTRDAYLSVKLI